MYLHWYDDNPKRSLEEKIAGALAAYREKFGTGATIVLCHPEQCIHRADVLIVSGESQGIPVRLNNFLVSRS